MYATTKRAKILGKYKVTETIYFLSKKLNVSSVDTIQAFIGAMGSKATRNTVRSYMGTCPGGLPSVSDEDEKEFQKILASIAKGEVQTVKQEETQEVKKHRLFNTLLKFCKARVNVWLVGPAGSGKTTAAMMVAEAMNLPFYFNGAIDSEYKLLGFTDAQGRVVNRPFRTAWENGGVYLFDEVDASLPGAVLAFNAALSNGICDFPDGAVEKHEDFICIAAGNTFDGTGEYVGRLKQDAAFLDRFAQLNWGYDEDLERALCADTEWCNFVQACRRNAKKHGLRVVISPRASMHGAKLLAAGVAKQAVIDATIRKGLSEENYKKLLEA